ncbi:hypothetical protein C2E23DRAFT_730301 [Lenzites betulinus]|nr:hypothetical protein C2E23DRAFT_730301 [Lenzites betulinus]
MSQANNQVAVAGPSALNLADPSRAARNGQHQVPRFLLKLYEIINAPGNEELIKWSEAGDSFYIYHQERFAREVLGKWFKHQNFSSFVRQLNLYGFRKISALQQGLLRMDHETETIQFAHPYFHRGQPDLLALIQRKRNPPGQSHAEESTGLLPASQDGKLAVQGVDVNMIIEGINSIRRQQQIIAADLNALKQSNDALWKEAIEARQRHAKHEDTINRILKFLAGLFGRVMHGHDNEKMHADDQNAPRKQMLMIGDGTDVFGGSDFDGHSDPGSRGASPFSMASERFATIETPGASVSSPVHSPAAVASVKPLHPVAPPLSTWPAPKSSVQPATQSASSSLLNHASTDGAAIPEAWQATFQHMLQSPEQYQRFMQTFANAQQPIPNLPTGPTQPPSGPEIANAPQFPPYSTTRDATAAVTPANQQRFAYPSYPASTFVQPEPQPHTQASSSLVEVPYPLPPAAHTAGPATAAEEALIHNTARMQKAYRDTAEINADMDMLQSNIHTLVRDMGLDPQNPVFPPVPATEDTHGVDHDDFSLDSWLEQLSRGSGGDHAGAVPDLAGQSGEGIDDISAFLNIPNIESAPGEVTSFPSTSTGMATSPSGQKRKLDTTEASQTSSEAEAPANKKKR